MWLRSLLHGSREQRATREDFFSEITQKSIISRIRFELRNVTGSISMTSAWLDFGMRTINRCEKASSWFVADSLVWSCYAQERTFNLPRISTSGENTAKSNDEKNKWMLYDSRAKIPEILPITHSVLHFEAQQEIMQCRLPPVKEKGNKNESFKLCRWREGSNRRRRRRRRRRR